MRSSIIQVMGDEFSERVSEGTLVTFIDRFAKYWSVVHTRLAKNRFVIGWDPLNEAGAPAFNDAKIYIEEFLFDRDYL